MMNTAEKDWDAIIAEEEASAKITQSQSMAEQIPRDMWYNQRNCARSAKTFAALKEAGAPGADLYGVVPKKMREDVGDDVPGAQEEEEATFWFLGKVAHISDVTLAQAVARQWGLIQQHAANLRPMELFGAASSLEMEIWSAPLDTEIDAAYNRPDSQFIKMARHVDGADDVKNTFVGFAGEVYSPDDLEGFRVWRSERTGRPTRPEIKGPADPATAGDNMKNAKGDEEEDEYRAPSDEELEKFMKATAGRDINEIYKEQERRKANGEFI
jgi:hypothetical protein